MSLRTHTYTEPRAGSGQVEYTWSRLEDADIVCILDYTPAERGAREGGLQMEPDYPEDMTLCEAWLFGVDITPLLTESQIEEIELAALAHRDDVAHEARMDAAQDRFERMRDAGAEVWA